MKYKAGYKQRTKARETTDGEYTRSTETLDPWQSTSANARPAIEHTQAKKQRQYNKSNGDANLTKKHQQTADGDARVQLVD